MFGNVTSVRHSSIIHKLLIFFEISFSEEDLRVIAGMLKLKLKQLEITVLYLGLDLSLSKSVSEAASIQTSTYLLTRHLVFFHKQTCYQIMILMMMIMMMQIKIILYDHELNHLTVLLTDDRANIFVDRTIENLVIQTPTRCNQSSNLSQTDAIPLNRQMER